MDLLEQMTDGFAELSPVQRYGIVLGLLVSSGTGLFSEDLVIIMAGFLSYLGHLSLSTALAVGYLGSCLSDCLMYGLGRGPGERLTRSRWLSRVLRPERVLYARELFQRRGSRFIVLVRFIPGMRAVVFFTAGTLMMPFRTFLFWDIVGVIPSVTLLMGTAYYCGENIERVVHQLGAWAWLVVLVGIGLFFTLARRSRNERAVAAKVEVRRRPETNAKPPAVTTPVTTAPAPPTTESPAGLVKSDHS